MKRCVLLLLLSLTIPLLSVGQEKPIPEISFDSVANLLHSHRAVHGRSRGCGREFERPHLRFSRSQESQLATFPAFGPPFVIVIGEPKNTKSMTSTPWLITLMHEHFHQLQNAQSRYFQAVQDLDLRHGDSTGMWMLNYPFSYEKPEVAQTFASLRDLLLSAVNETDKEKFARLGKQYIEERKKFFAQFSSDDHKYLSFQLWQEGIARYTEIKAAEAAAQYQPTAEYAALSDFEPFTTHAAKARSETLNELRQADLAKSKRIVVYSFGAVEGLLLDRVDPNWKDEYFQHLLSTDSFFEN